MSSGNPSINDITAYFAAKLRQKKRSQQLNALDLPSLLLPDELFMIPAPPSADNLSEQPVNATGSAIDSTPSLVEQFLQGKDPETKSKIYEFILTNEIDPNDPILAHLIACGYIETLLITTPDKLKALYDHWKDDILRNLKIYQQTLKEAAIASQKNEDAETSKRVNQLILNTALSKFANQFTLASILISAFALLAAGTIGGALGISWEQQQKKLIYSEKPVKLTEDQVRDLNWLSSKEGKYAKQLYEWNKPSLQNFNCEKQIQNLNLTLVQEGQIANKGTCFLYVRPQEQRQIRPAYIKKQ